MISNLLDLQYEMTRDEPTRQALEDCRSRIRAIMLVYQRSSQSEGRSRIDFADYLGRLLARLFQATMAVWVPSLPASVWKTLPSAWMRPYPAV